MTEWLRIYVAGALFSEAERAWLDELAHGSAAKAPTASYLTRLRSGGPWGPTNGV